MTKKLMPQTQAPALSVETLDGGRWTLSEQKPRTFTMVVFYRGNHCPVCKSYLQKLETLVDKYEAEGVSVVAVSMDSEEKAGKSKEDWGLERTRIGYGLSEDKAREWGLYISKAVKDSEASIFCEPGTFWVDPDGKLYLIDVSNMPWARPDLEFLLSKISFINENQYPARGTLAA